MKQTGKAKILIIICIIVLCAVTYRTTGTINLVVNGIKTEGTIIGHSCKPINSFDSTGSVQILCTLKVSYLDKNNQKHEFETDVLAREESYPKGTTVNVIYSEENKLNFVLDISKKYKHRINILHPHLT